MSALDAYFKIESGEIHYISIRPSYTVKQLLQLAEKEAGQDLSMMQVLLKDEVLDNMRVTMQHLGVKNDVLFKIKPDPKAEATHELTKQSIRANGKSLRNMAAKNEIESVKKLLTAGVNPDSQSDSNGNTALIISCSMGYWKIAKHLIVHGCDIELTDKDGCTALWHAAIHLRLKTLELLMNNNAEVNIGSNEGIPTITQVVTIKHSKTLPIVESLLKHGAVVYNPTLINAVESDNVEVVQAILEAGTELDIETAHGVIDDQQPNSSEIMKLLEKRLPKVLTNLHSNESHIFTAASIRTDTDTDCDSDTTSTSCIFQAVGTPSDALCRDPSVNLSVSHNKVSLDEDSESSSSSSDSFPS